MIKLMSSGGFKVFDSKGDFIGAYNNYQLAFEVDRLERPLTTEEFDTLFGVTHEKETNPQATEI